MADLSELSFDASTIEPQDSFEPIPIGEYLAIITASELKDTKSGTGKYLQLVYDILEGEYKGRKIWERINVINSNVTAQEIGQRALSGVCRAVGIMNPNDSCQLHDIPLKIIVKIKPAVGEYAATNVISNHKPANENPKAPNKKASGVRPWE
jgi:hypothetical protein